MNDKLKGKLIGLAVSVFLMIGITGNLSSTPLKTSTDYFSFQNNTQGEAISFPVKTLTKKRFNFSAITSGLKIKSIPKDNVIYHQFLPSGGRLFGEVGKPGLPGFTRLIAVPQGAKVQITITEGKAQVFDGNLIYPVQPLVGENSPEPPFIIDSKFYQTNMTYPERLFSIEYDWVRGCKIAIVHVHTARYNPYQRRLTYYPELEVDIRFEGGKNIYIAEDKRSIFFEEMYGRIFPNYKVVETELPDLVAKIPLRQRCDLLIITPTVFEAQARELAEWKRAKGFVTKVVTLDDIERARGGTTAEDIRAYIRNIYATSTNLSYVLLLGDAEFIPPHYEMNLDTSQGTDLYYAEMDGEGFFPDLGIGRIPVNTDGEAQIVVNKIINYEKNPPDDPNFYGRIVHAAYFEDLYGGTAEPNTWASDGREDRDFVQIMEEIRSFFLDVEGFPFLPRVYFADPTYWPEGLLGPQWFNDGTPLPEELRWPGFAWDGRADAIINQLELGALMIIYRGHGWNDTWSSLGFWKESLVDLHNSDLTPVVLSLTCRTGWFDNETDDETFGTAPEDESLAEALLVMEGGAIAVVAATRESNSLANNKMAIAFIDAIWNRMLPYYNGTEDLGDSLGEESKRLGDALNYAKFYLLDYMCGTMDTCQFLYEQYLLFGDPTMEIWTHNPYPAHYIPVDPHIYQPIEPLKRNYAFPIEIEGVTVTLIQKREIIGQGISKKGRVKIKLESPLLNSKDTVLTFTKKGYLTQVVPLKFVNSPGVDVLHKSDLGRSR